jgi:hypothetical protein
MLTFDESELTTLRCALELARDKYRENAATLRQDSIRLDRPGKDRLAEQFDRQAADCETLLEKLEA